MNSILTRMKKEWTLPCFICCAGLLSAGTLSAQSVFTDSVEIKLFFPLGQSTIDESYRDNGLRLIRFGEAVQRIQQDKGLRLTSIGIVSGVSPEGAEEVNEVLTQERGLSLLRYLKKLTGLKQTKFQMDFRGIDWQRLTAIVEFSEMPYREEVLEVLRNSHVTTYGEGSDDDRICKLKALREGVPYAYMQEHFFPVLRNAGQQVVCRFERVEDVKAVEEKKTVKAKEIAEHQEQTGSALDDVSATAGNDVQAALVPEHTASTGSFAAPSNPQRDPRPLFALKTNLLFDAALMPNVEAEVPIGKRWSVMGEWTFPWWRKSDNSSTLQYLNGGLEGRYWFRPWADPDDHRLTGHFIGVFGGTGKYDLGHHSKGYNGTFWMAGISYGYALALSRALSLEFSLGAGWLTTDYTHYRVENGIKYRIPEEDPHYDWFGPLKAKISLVWMLFK